MPDPGGFPPGATVAGRYRIVDALGRGGMGEVYRAEDLKLRQSVALKFLPPDLEARPAVLERFLGEVRIARQITHPHVCRVYDVDEVDGRHFLSMELIEGGNLAELLKRLGRLPSAKVIRIGHEIASGLDAIHEQGIIHRDLKPSNLMLDARGRIRIADFGIAEIVENIDSLEIGLGTPAYMAPEQIDGEKATARSDLYSLGLVLYELVTGEPGFVAQSLGELFTRRREELVPVPVEERVADVDPLLARVIRRCLAPDPGDRPSSAQAVAAILGDEATLAGTLVRTLLIHRPDAPETELELELLELHGGRSIATGDGARLVFFERPGSALQYALAAQRLTGEASPEGMGIHVGEIEVGLREGRPVAEGEALTVVRSLRELARPAQTLLSRLAFDLARQGAGGLDVDGSGAGKGLRWLAHGEYELARAAAEPFEVFEIGEVGVAPLEAPPASAAGRPLQSGDAILGWRAAPGLEIPRRPSWRLERKLGEGGFGEVWFAENEKTGERRVFKFCYDASRLRSLKREITLFRLLKEELGDRPDIARILDWNFDEAPYFLEVEHSESGSLPEWAGFEGGLPSIPLAERLEIVAQVATALQAAHSVGILHKDVKPSNVLIRRTGDGVRAQLADFGIGEVIERGRLQAAGFTVAGLTMMTETVSSYAGTRLYMAPELLEGKVATVQADVYALGVLLYQMAVGDFTRALAPGWERDIDDELLRADIAAAVDGVPERRLASAGRLAERIRSLADRRAAREAAKRRREHERRAAKRTRVYQAGAAVLVILLLAGFFHLQALRQEFARTESFLKLAVANDWLDKDPTLAGRVLLEVDAPEAQPYAVDLMRQILQEPLATAELEHDGPVYMADFDPTGETVVTASEDGTARLWNVETGAELVVFRHDGAVRTARFDPSGERLLTASEDGTARLWRTDGEPVRTFRHEDVVREARFSPKGDRILTASEDGAARVWDLASDAPPRVFRHEDVVRRAVFHPDGDRILTASNDGTARLWWFDGREKPSVLRHGGRVWRADFFPDGRRILTSSRDGKVRLWDPVLERSIILTREDDHGTLLAVTFDPGGDRVAVASFETIWVWQIEGLRQIGDPLRLEGHDSSILSLAFTADGKRLLSASHDGSSRFWSVPLGSEERSANEERVLRGHRDRVNLAVLDPRGERVITTSQDGTARLWTIHPQEPRILSHPGVLRSLDISPRGDRIATASRGGTVRVWSIDDPVIPLAELKVDAPVEEVVFDPRGEILAVAADDGLLRLWSFDEISPRVFSGHRGAVRRIVYSPDGAWIGTASNDGTARIWSSDGRRSRVLEHRGPVLTVTFDSRSRRLASGAEDGLVRLWDLDGRLLRKLAGHEGDVEQVDFSPDGEFLISGSVDATARVWPLSSDREPRILHSGYGVYAVGFSSDGRRLLTGSGDETVKVLERQDGDDPWGGEPLTLMHRRVGGVLRAVFDTEGKRIVSGTDDGSVWVWALGGDTKPTVLRGHGATAWAVAFHPSGDRILTAAGDGTARVWRLEPAKLSGLLQASSRICLAPRFRQEHFAEVATEARQRFGDCQESIGRSAQEKKETMDLDG